VYVFVALLCLVVQSDCICVTVLYVSFYGKLNDDDDDDDDDDDANIGLIVGVFKVHCYVLTRCYLSSTVSTQGGAWLH